MVHARNICAAAASASINDAYQNGFRFISIAIDATAIAI
jgi:hypothetical protein